MWAEKNLHYAPGLEEELKRIDEWTRYLQRLRVFEGISGCYACGYKREENGVLRCPYSTVDLDLNGFCHRWKEEEQA